MTLAAGAAAPLVWDAGAELTGAQVTITPAVGDAVLGPTGDGLGADGTLHTYVWQIPADLAAGPYTATLTGTAGAVPVVRTLSLYVTADPVYADLATLKNEYTITDDLRDDLIVQALEAASRYVDEACGRRFWLDALPTSRVVPTTRRVVVDAEGAHLLVRDIGDVQDLAVEIGRGTSWTDVTSSVEVEPLDALDERRPVTSLLRGSWPSGGQRVRITARWGWPAVPAQVRTATLRQASRLFKRKDSPDGVTGSAEWGIVRVSRVDPDVAALIRPYVLAGLG